MSFEDSHTRIRRHNDGGFVRSEETGGGEDLAVHMILCLCVQAAEGVVYHQHAFLSVRRSCECLLRSQPQSSSLSARSDESLRADAV